MDRKYKCVFFDLDHTLWDYETNATETLRELYNQYDLHEKGVWNFESFNNRFRQVNTELWELFDAGIITSEVIRRERFKQTLEPFYAHQQKLSEDLSRDFLAICPHKQNLIPHALEVLDYLHGRYNLTVVTNGLEEIQNIKLRSGDLHKYFDHVVTSQTAGCRKPSREIFAFALQHNAIECHEAIMIGDNLVTDIGGSRNASIDNVFFNPDKINHESVVTHEISSLSELRQIL